MPVRRKGAVALRFGFLLVEASSFWMSGVSLATNLDATGCARRAPSSFPPKCIGLQHSFSQRDRITYLHISVPDTNPHIILDLFLASDIWNSRPDPPYKFARLLYKPLIM